MKIILCAKRRKLRCLEILWIAGFATVIVGYKKHSKEQIKSKMRKLLVIDDNMEFKVYPFNTLNGYFSADIIAMHKGKWVFCKHKHRTTWEHPSGWIEAGESPLEAAKRELFEETGSIKFDIEPLCDYYIDMELNGFHYKGNGQVYFATIYSFGEIPPYSEMGEIGFFDALPDNLTYPILKDYFSIAEKKLHAKQENQSFNK